MWEAFSALFGGGPGDAIPLQTSGMLMREQCLDFFQRCETLLASGEIQSHLRISHVQGQDVEDAITALQLRVFEEMGVQGAFGLQCLSQISTVYKADKAVIALLYRHVYREEEAASEAEMSYEQLRQKRQAGAAMAGRQAELQEKLQALPPEQREDWLRQQEHEIVQQLGTPSAAPSSAPTVHQSAHGDPDEDQPLDSMSTAQREHFFKSLRPAS